MIHFHYEIQLKNFVHDVIKYRIYIDINIKLFTFFLFLIKIFERVLAQIAPVVREEQLFCVNFFNFLEEETISGDVSYFALLIC